MRQTIVKGSLLIKSKVNVPLIILRDSRYEYVTVEIRNIKFRSA